MMRCHLHHLLLISVVLCIYHTCVDARYQAMYNSCPYCTSTLALDAGQSQTLTTACPSGYQLDLSFDIQALNLANFRIDIYDSTYYKYISLSNDSTNCYTTVDGGAGNIRNVLGSSALIIVTCSLADSCSLVYRIYNGPASCLLPSTYSWLTLQWSSCSASCVQGTQTRDVLCQGISSGTSNPTTAD